MRLSQIIPSALLTLSLVGMAPAFAAEDYTSSNDTDETITAVHEEFLAHMPEFGEHKSFCEELNLSDDQMQRLIDLKCQLQVDTAAKKAEIHAKKREMAELFLAPSVDKQKILGLQHEVNSLWNELGNAHTNYMLDVSSVFTADQKKLLRHKMLSHMLMSNWMHGHMHHHHMWHHHMMEHEHQGASEHQHDV